ncbi:hypothetical protein HKD37_18G050249 [Glycine soja]
MYSAPSNPVTQSVIPVAEKLDDSNYLHWRHHVEPVIKRINYSISSSILSFRLAISWRMIVLQIM